MPNDRFLNNDITTNTVTALIKIEDQEIPRTHQVLNIIVDREINRIPLAKINLIDGDSSQEDFPISNEELFIPGKDIEIYIGYDADEDLLFKGIIIKHGISIKDKRSLLKLTCKDVVFKSSLCTKNRYFTDLSDSEVLEEIFGGYEGLSFEITETEISHQELIQYEVTDWDFALSRAKANSLFCFVENGKVAIGAPDLEGESVLTLQYGTTIMEFDAEIDARQQFSKVVGRSWDYVNQELLEAEAEDPQIPGGGNLEALSLAEVGGNVSFDLRHSGQVVQEELQAWADAFLLTKRLQKVRGRVKFEGKVDLQLGQWITLQGVGDRFNGLVYISGIRQAVQNGSWHSHVQFGLPKENLFKRASECSPSSNQLLAGISGLQVGKVTQLQDDPDGENRILVQLPIISAEEEGIWARVATLDAGENRGTFFMPDIGDEVIVGFVNRDPRDPVVLGMLHSSNKAAPIEATDDNFIKGIFSKSEMKISFDDEKKILSLETPGGKKITMDEDEGHIKLEDENDNKIVLDSNGIMIESGGDLILKSSQNIEVEGGANVAIKAGAELKAEGSAGAELSTSAVAILKGSLVQIN